MGFLKKLFGPGKGFDVDELARRLGREPGQLEAIQPAYTTFRIAKRAGGQRTIDAPSAELKTLQRAILGRLLARLKAHPSATGFERGHSIVSNAAFHAGKAVVVNLDIEDFFGTIREKRVRKYFQAIGWNREAATLLTRLCTHRGALPQGAPTSPRLSNLVNYRLDTRMARMATKSGADYTRYADDLVFSFPEDNHAAVTGVLRCARAIAKDEGYTIHRRKKVHVRRSHQQQIVTGLVVNKRAALPRETRRWLRAVEHRMAQGKPATLTEAQLAGWHSLQHMIETQGAQLK